MRLSACGQLTDLQMAIRKLYLVIRVECVMFGLGGGVALDGHLTLVCQFEDAVVAIESKIMHCKLVKRVESGL